MPIYDHQEIKPCPALQTLVKNYLVCHLSHNSKFLPVTPYPARIENALVFFARGYVEAHDPACTESRKIASTALFGQHVSRLSFQPVSDEDFLMVHVVFQPGALHRLIGLPLNEITQQFCDAGSVMTPRIASLNDAIANAGSYNAIIDLLDRYLLAQIKSLRIEPHPVDHIAHLLMAQNSAFSLDKLANQANLSPRQFERKFKERFGIGPKLYSRVSRFYHAFKLKSEHPALDWLSIAVEFGYTDYDHLAKDFKQFGNVTPNIMIDQYAERPEAVILKLN